MSRPDKIIIDGRAYRWRDIVELRRQQLEAWKAARPEQPALFALKEDSRPGDAAHGRAGATGSRVCSTPCGGIKMGPTRNTTDALYLLLRLVRLCRHASFLTMTASRHPVRSLGPKKCKLVSRSNNEFHVRPPRISTGNTALKTTTM